MKKILAKAMANRGFVRYFKNTSWLFGGQMLRMVLGLIVSVAVARYLGPENLGLYNYVLAIVALVAVVTNLGLQNLVKRELVATPERHDVILGTCFVLSLIAGIVAYSGMLVIVAYITDSSLVLGLFAILGGSLLLNPLKCITLWFQAQVRSDLSVKASGITMLVFAAIKIVAIGLGAKLIHFSYLYIIELLVLMVLQIFFYGCHYGRVRAWRIDRELALKYLRKSWPLLLSGLAVTVYMQVDQIMLGSMLGKNAVGQYSVAVRISSIWYMIPTLLATSLFPPILNARKKSKAFYEERLQRYLDLNAGLAYLICIPLSLTSYWVIAILFGAQYEGATPILAIHIWSSLFVFLGVARGQYIIAEELFKFSMVSTIIGAIVNIALNYILIPRYGGVGAALATLVSQFISAFASSYFYLPVRDIGRLQTRSLFPFARILLLIK
ncbi:flippase [Verrucomicrobiaceae bacterium 5K15]|uniref:Flippase n=1 Tax=Oceaniferula flava TaxID=2800421 RepID=A0AAE2SFR1_9BACT|nr:flippase [Oceaniferula flavus]MBK1856537.1 flippase [Oceaniferula flavus]MBM1137844.1 flippase [Oceaniferula flavus]